MAQRVAVTQRKPPAQTPKLNAGGYASFQSDLTSSKIIGLAFAQSAEFSYGLRRKSANTMNGYPGWAKY